RPWRTLPTTLRHAEDTTCRPQPNTVADDTEPPLFWNAVMTATSLIDPRTKYPATPFPNLQQAVPGEQPAMNPVPDCGEHSYVGSGKLNGRKAIITGGDSGIGRAVAIAYAREGADILISYLNEHQDAEATAELVRGAGRNCV